MTKIHPTAVIDPQVEFGPGCEVGPYCVLEGPIRLGARNRLISHVRMDGPLTVGDDNEFHPFCVVGARPQDLKYKGEDTQVQMGSRNSIRECVTIHRGTVGGAPTGKGVTRLGDDCLIMAYTHVAHDCVIGNRVVIANATQLAGHVLLEDDARLGGANLVVQNVRIGRFAFTGAGVSIRKDVAPFVIGSGPDFAPSGINAVGLKRAGISEEIIRQLKDAYRTYFSGKLTHQEALQALKTPPETQELHTFIRFLETSQLGVHRP